jgi:YfiH family protein
MKELQTKFNFITPKLLQNEQNVRAWFTLKNEEYGQSGRSIPGLNLGFNTTEKKEIVAQNRLALLSSLQIDPDRVAYADQVHSNRIQFVTEEGIYPTTDGLITRMPGLTLGIQVADCAAILMWDTANRVIGALHAGWRGAAGDILPQGIEKMVEQGAVPNQIKLFISPCISQQNFEVGPEVANQFPDQFIDYENYAKPHVDLKGFLTKQALEAGIAQSHIEVREECTIENHDHFYSYRRESDQSGRMLALIQMIQERVN